MKEIFLFCLLLFGFLSPLFSQTVAFSKINQPNINLRGNPVVLGQVAINAPANGKVILRFDGHCISSEGDRIILAASETSNWGPNDDNVELEAPDGDVKGSAFSHTRGYGVDSGETTFYAVAQNEVEMDGDGMASIFGSLTAEWFPNIPETGMPFVQHKGFFSENVFVSGGPIVLSTITIDVPVSGKALVRFDGKCVATYGDLMFFAASDTPDWTDEDGSSSNEVIDDNYNRFSFAHVRAYDIEPGSHTFYAVAENYYEDYGNGFASIYGSLTVQFYPDSSVSAPVFQPISTPFTIAIDGPPVVVGQINFDVPVTGKVELNFAGTCIASYGDQVQLAASDVPNWGSEDGSITYEPYSSTRNRVSFSHTRVYDILPGNHDFYAVVQNFEHYDGGGLAVIYASFTARFFPDSTTSGTQGTDAFCNVKISPNPSSEFASIAHPELAQEAFIMTLSDQNGRVLRTFEKSGLDYSEETIWDVSNLPLGVYFIKIRNKKGASVRQFLRI